MAALRKYAERIDELSLRERLLLFVGLAVVLVSAGQVILFDPLSAKQKQLTERLRKSEIQIQAIQGQLQAMVQAKSQDPDATNRARLAALQKRLEAVETKLRGTSGHLVEPERIAVLLQEILRRNRSLELVSLVSLAAAPLGEKAAGPDKVGSPAPGPMYRHGVEVTVRGSYPELLRYVSDLEALPWRMYWGKASLKVEKYPAASLSFTVYTLSLDKTWLTV